eukprot:Seg780.6 transcript_id=Seg780.6/GoldUCD/mRNA.D3Y31 product=Tyrosinase protein_id=Seg780.6/GoldUCD/D3Y31
MTNCARVRKEFTEMTEAERERYIDAFKFLASDKRYKKRFENYIKIHKDLFFKGIHTANYFLPWHRWYVLTFENLLREIDCRITVPYWDWAFWSKSAWNENIHIWNGHKYGLGGNGDPKKGYCVQDGPFREGAFNTASFDNEGEVLSSVAYAIKDLFKKIKKTPNKGGCLRRSFNGKPVGVPEIKKILKHRAGSFAKFEALVRESLHNSIHNEIGGHMCSVYASLAPEFYLHHSFLDKLWYTWQQHSKACLYASFSKANRKMLKFRCHHSQREMIDSSRLPGNVNVTYTDYIYGKNKISEQHDTEERKVPEGSLRKDNADSVMFSDMVESRELFDENSRYDRDKNRIVIGESLIEREEVSYQDSDETRDIVRNEDRKLVGKSSNQLGEEMYRDSDESSDMERDEGWKIIAKSSNELEDKSYRGFKETSNVKRNKDRPVVAKSSYELGDKLYRDYDEITDITDINRNKDRPVVGTSSHELGEQSYQDFGEASNKAKLTKMQNTLPNHDELDNDQRSASEDENLESEDSYAERFEEGANASSEDSHWPPYEKFSIKDVIRRLSS